MCDVLLAHELYHVLQYRHPEFYTMQQHILLWRLLGHEKRSRLVSLEEVAAMAFAGSLTGIHYTPYVYDVLLMLPHYPEQAKEIYRGLLAIRDRQRKEEA